MRRLLASALVAVTALLPIACSAADPQPNYTEGTNYKIVRQPAPSDGKRIAVEEFFWYGCGHCYAFEPLIEKWAAKKAADVDFVRVPNSLGRPVGMTHAKAYYAMEELKLLGKGHRAFFDAIHQQHLNLETEPAIQAFITDKTGVMPDVFNAAFKGFSVDSKARRGEELARQYGVASTPTLVVAGRYQINATMNQGFPEMLKVADFLIDKTRKERKKK